MQPVLLYALNHPHRVIKSKHISMGWDSKCTEKTDRHALQSEHSVGQTSRPAAVRAAAPRNHERARRGRRARPRGTRTVAGLTVRDGSAAENVMPFSRQPRVIRLLYPGCSVGILLLSLPSLIISSRELSCERRRSNSWRIDVSPLSEIPP